MLVLPLTGCYSIVTINFASINKQAATTGPAMAPSVQCAALLTPPLAIGGTPSVAGGDSLALCEEIITRQQAKKASK